MAVVDDDYAGLLSHADEEGGPGRGYIQEAHYRGGRGVSILLIIGVCILSLFSRSELPKGSQPTKALELQSAIGLANSPGCPSIPPLELLNLAHQNLGGFGPGEGPQNLRYANVTKSSGKEVDLVISTVDKGYEPMSGDKSGLSGSFGRINIQPDHRTKLKFQFVQHGTDIPVKLDEFAFTFYDIDGKQDTEKLEVCGGKLSLNKHSKLESTQTKDCTEVKSGSDGVGVENPKSPSMLTTAQKEVSAMYSFRNRDFFEVTLTTHSKHGRNFFFSGVPVLACDHSITRSTSSSLEKPTFTSEPSSETPPTTSVASFGSIVDVEPSIAPGTPPEASSTAAAPECKSEIPSLNLLTLAHRNLGGSGPDKHGPQNLRYANVATINGEEIDLVVSTLDHHYEHMSGDKSGLKGSFGRLYIPPDHSTKLRFQFVKKGVDVPVKLDKFAFTFYDIDGKVGTETLEVCGGKLSLAESSKLESTERADCTAVSSGSESAGVDNPRNPSSLTAAQREVSAMYTFQDRDSFEASLTTHSKHGRNFFFSGIPALICSNDVHPIESWDLHSSTTSSPEALSIARTSTPTVSNPECSEVPSLGLQNLVHANLGGFGPGNGAETLRYGLAGVTSWDYEAVELVVSIAGDGYEPMFEGTSGLSGYFGTISMYANFSAKLRFEFVKKGSDIPVQLDKFAFTFYDIDGENYAEHLEVCGAQVSVDKFSKLKTINVGGCAAVTSGSDGVGVENPTIPFPLTTAQREVTATYIFEHRDSFEVSLTTHLTHGRYFFFSCVPVFCPPTETTSKTSIATTSMFGSTPDEPSIAPETPSETSSTILAPECNSEIPPLNLLTLAHQNLGGFGPDKGAPEVRYANVTVMNGEKIDLVVFTLDRGYEPMSGEKSGLKGSFGRLNIQPDHSTRLRFQFVRKGSNAPVRLHKFAFTFYDIDGKVGTEKLEVCGGKLLLEKSSKLESDKTNDCIAVTSGSEGIGVANPTNPSSLTTAQKEVSATYTFEDRDYFEVSLTTHSKHGRNFFFSGVPVLDCDHPTQPSISSSPEEPRLAPKKPSETSSTTSASISGTPKKPFPKMASTAHTSERSFGSTPDEPSIAPDTPFETPSTMAAPECKSEIRPLNLLTLAHQNLGGFGPDRHGPDNLRYANVTILNGNEVDLVVSTLDHGYEPMSGERSGLKGLFGRLNIQPDHSTTLRFQFVKKGTDVPLKLHKFAFTFYDIDGKVGTERLKVCGGKLLLEKSSKLETSRTDDCIEVASGNEGAGVENPKHPSSLSAAQKEVSATYTFEDRDFFEVSLTTHSKHGRNFFFSGVPVLACAHPTKPLTSSTLEALTPQSPSASTTVTPTNGPPDEAFVSAGTLSASSVPKPAHVPAISGAAPTSTFLPTSSTKEETSIAPETLSVTVKHVCSSETPPALDLSNLVHQNLGGFGPDSGAENLRYGNVITVEGVKVDLVVSSVFGGYEPISGEKSGLSGSFGRINIAHDHGAKLNFQFVDSGTSKPVILSRFAFTFYDIDGKKDTEMLEVCGGHLRLSESSKLESSKVEDCSTVRSGSDGAGVENPKNPSDLTAAQKEVSATFTFKDRDFFEVSLMTHSKHGRNFFFSGVPILACSPELSIGSTPAEQSV